MALSIALDEATYGPPDPLAFVGEIIVFVEQRVLPRFKQFIGPVPSEIPPVPVPETWNTIF